jgi:hypothetical protein
MERHKPTIEFHGPAATHDMPCCVDYLVNEPAVYDMSCGVFMPSWKAQQRGWRLVYANTAFKRWLLRTFFGERHDRP